MRDQEISVGKYGLLLHYFELGFLFFQICDYTE